MNRLIESLITIAPLAILVFGGLGCIGMIQDKVLSGGARKAAMAIAPIPHGVMSPSFATLHMIAVILLVAHLISGGEGMRKGSRKNFLGHFIRTVERGVSGPVRTVGDAFTGGAVSDVEKATGLTPGGYYSNLGKITGTY